MNTINISNLTSALFEPDRLVDPSAWYGHIPFAFWIVSLLKPKIVLELGTQNGISYSSFCKSIKKNNLSTTAYAVDTWEGDPHAGFYGEETYLNFKDYHDQHYSQFSTLLRMTFDEAVHQFSDQSIDLLHIDGLHTYEAVKHDFETWLPKLSKRAVVLFHDTCVYENNFGVYQLWEELVAEYPGFNFTHSHGLGVLLVGRERHPFLKELADLENFQASSFNQLFQKLGDNYELTYSLRKHQLDFAEQKKLIEENQELVQSQAVTIQEKENLINQKNKLIYETEKQLQNQTAIIDEKNVLLAEKEHQLADRQKQLVEQEELIEQKNILITKKDRQLAEKSQLIFNIQNKKLLRASIKALIVLADLRTSFKRYVITFHIGRSNLFDQEWYLERYPDVKHAGVNPILHYINTGALEGRDPSPLFNTKWYLKENRDVAQSKINPLYHYVKFGCKEGRVPNEASGIIIPFNKKKKIKKKFRDLQHKLKEQIKFYQQKQILSKDICQHLNPARDQKADVCFSTAQDESIKRQAIAPDIRLIAIYLPQYHPIKENSIWWGEGFTEWTNVKRAIPFYKEHYQPHIPHPDIGYYDLNDESVLEKQAQLAREHGIYGFCFYYYWFNGRRLLEKPTDRLLKSGKPDFPFCFCWANENWTRTWDGGDHQILIGQEHSKESDEQFIYDLIPALKDKRYIKIDNKPLIVIYRPALLPDMKKTAERWRRICRTEGIGEIYLAGMRSFELINPFKYGLDAAIQFPLSNVPAHNLASDPKLEVVKPFSGSIYSMVQAREFYSKEEQKFPLIRSVSPSWDNTARRMGRGTSWINATPANYYKWLCQAIRKTRELFKETERFIFINAWNEWGEGCHLEPDQKFGYAWLNATRKAISNISDKFTECNETENRHSIIYEDRRRNLEESFASLIDWSQFGYLANYHGLFSLIANQKNVSFCIENGMPALQINGRLISLKEPSSLKSLHFLIPKKNNIICFILLQYNQVEATEECVESLRELDFQGRKRHIIIVDNKSNNHVIEKTKKLFGSAEDVTLLFNEVNCGFAKGNNIGYAFAKKELNPEFIIVLNNDVIINDKKVIVSLLKLYEQYSYSLLGPDIVIPDGRKESPLNDYIYDLKEWHDLNELYQREKAYFLKSGIAQFKKFGRSSPAKEVIINPILQGAAYILSPIFIESENLIFNESTFLYGEELLLAIQCLLKGHLMLYSSKLGVIHKEGVSTKTLAEREKYIYGYDNAILATTLCCSWLEGYLKAKKGEWISFQETKKGKFSQCLKQYQKNILYDLLFSQPGFHGGGEYGKILFKKTVLECQKRGDVKLWAALNPDLYIDTWVLELCKKYAVNLIQVESFKDIAQLVSTDEFSLFFAPAIVVYTGYEYMKKVGTKVLFSNRKTKVIGCLHDIRDFELANDFEKICSLRKAIGCVKENSLTPKEMKHEIDLKKEHAEELKVMYQKICEATSISQLITVSEYSLKSIQKNIGEFKNIPKVLFPPIKNRATPKSLDNMQLQERDYILVVHAGRFEKNAPLAVKAFDDLCSDVQFSSLIGDLKMFLSGIRRFEDLKLTKIKNPNRFILTETLLPEHYEFVLKHARFLIYPTFNEGFGYPPVEAMTYGIPSIVSKAASIPEVCGKAVMYCNPYHLDSLKEAIIEMIRAPISKEKIKTQYNSIVERQKRDVDCLINLISSC